MRLKPSVLYLFAASLILSGCSVKTLIRKADKRYDNGEYFVAADLYKNVYSNLQSKDKDLKGRVAFRQAECYRLINNSRAEATYEKAIRYNYSDSLLLLHYAQVLQQNGKYGEAAANYQLVLKKDSANIVALNGLKACRSIAEMQKVAVYYAVKKVDLFNLRRTSNFCPAYVGVSGDMVAFSTTRPPDKKTVQKNNTVTGLPNNDIYISRKNAVGKWETPEAIEGEINTTDDEGACSFTSDGKQMFYTHSSQAADGHGTEILMSNRAGGTWSKPQKIKIFADSTISVAHPAVSPDGLTLYFVSDNKKGLGGKDIWKGTLASGECKYIENLGPDINTPGDEMFPSVGIDGALYFSSNGRVGFGGLDIYKATPKKEGGWIVENMGPPVNSGSDDFGITFEGKSPRGFFSSNRNETKGLDAIWSLELPEYAYSIEGKVTDEKGVEIPEATIRMVSNTGLNTRIVTKKDGTYRIKIDKDMDCIMQASARGYLNQKNSVSSTGLEDSKVFTVNFKLSSISKPIQIENIFYEFAKWDLTPASEAGLQVLVKMLNDNPNITIEISANTDYVGSNADNKILSERRAKSVVDYLISKKIAADRLSSVGFGEEKPVTVDAALAKKYSFLKENDVLDENYIQKLTPEQQEIANQINRRTEFRVLKTTYKLY